jgi:hypothetical protein
VREIDPLSGMLRGWKAPDPPAAMDARVLSAYREQYAASPWRRFWGARISVPVPVFAALLLVLAAMWMEFRPAPSVQPAVLRTETRVVSTPEGRGCVTRLDASGFQPLPDGAARVVGSGEIRQ